LPSRCHRSDPRAPPERTSAPGTCQGPAALCSNTAQRATARHICFIRTALGRPLHSVASGVLTQSGRLHVWFLFRFDFFPSKKMLGEKKDVIIISSSSTLLIPAKKSDACWCIQMRVFLVVWASSQGGMFIFVWTKPS